VAQGPFPLLPLTLNLQKMMMSQCQMKKS